MDLGGRFPFPQQLRNRPIVVHGGRRQQRLRQLVHKQHSINLGQKSHPCRRGWCRFPKRTGVVRCKVAQHSREDLKRFGAIFDTVRSAQAQSRSTASPQQHIVVSEFSDYIVGVTQQVREWPLSDSDGLMISELVMKCSGQSRAVLMGPESADLSRTFAGNPGAVSGELIPSALVS